MTDKKKNEQKAKNTEIDHDGRTEIPGHENLDFRDITYAPGENKYLNENGQGPSDEKE
ncbi:hypothetical protein [Salirhabdus salicampi]|uniref:hypothetical protein n=1 Tax=Salirhabdus salicampi TaxID=476102 RepID=UPI0020C3D52A|nr:hypothetical protein [Salirhabdus salicampi]MCP8615279.1 hypothetical protein [Salirhabdus salicampi]